MHQPMCKCKRGRGIRQPPLFREEGRGGGRRREEEGKSLPVTAEEEGRRREGRRTEEEGGGESREDQYARLSHRLRRRGHASNTTTVTRRGPMPRPKGLYIIVAQRGYTPDVPNAHTLERLRLWARAREPQHSRGAVPALQRSTPEGSGSRVAHAAHDLLTSNTVSVSCL